MFHFRIPPALSADPGGVEKSSDKSSTHCSGGHGAQQDPELQWNNQLCCCSSVSFFDILLLKHTLPHDMEVNAFCPCGIFLWLSTVDVSDLQDKFQYS